jgi:hypothetical protein
MLARRPGSRRTRPRGGPRRPAAAARHLDRRDLDPWSPAARFPRATSWAYPAMRRPCPVSSRKRGSARIEQRPPNCRPPRSGTTSQWASSSPRAWAARSSTASSSRCSAGCTQATRIASRCAQRYPQLFEAAKKQASLTEGVREHPGPDGRRPPADRLGLHGHPGRRRPTAARRRGVGSCEWRGDPSPGRTGHRAAAHGRDIGGVAGRAPRSGCIDADGRGRRRARPTAAADAARRRGARRSGRTRRRGVRLDGPDDPGLPPQPTTDLPEGSGFLVPPVDGHTIKASTFASQQVGLDRGGEPGPAGSADLGRDGTPRREILQREDTDLMAVSRRDLQARRQDWTAGPRRDPRHPLGTTACRSTPSATTRAWTASANTSSKLPGPRRVRRRVRRGGHPGVHRERLRGGRRSCG